MNESERLRGCVKWFNDKLGYGFIETENGQDIFFHFSSIEGDGYKSLNDGTRVELEIEDSPRGPLAKAVKEI